MCRSFVLRRQPSRRLGRPRRGEHRQARRPRNAAHPQRGEAAATANGRDVIQPHDLPITKGLQECIHTWKRLDAEIDLQPILDCLAARPPLDLARSDETDAELPRIVSGVSVALARAFTIIERDLKKPQSRHWEQATGLFNLLL